MGSLADGVKGNINHNNLEHFNEFLRGYTDIYTNSIPKKFMLQKIIPPWCDLKQRHHSC